MKGSQSFDLHTIWQLPRGQESFDQLAFDAKDKLDGARAALPAIGFVHTHLKAGKAARTPTRSSYYVSLSPAAMGNRAARSAGKNPPTSPMPAAQIIAAARSCGVTAKAKAIWLKVCQLIVAAWKPSNAR
jgi:hypothetical protein